MDVFSKKKRSEIMGRVRQKDTTPEVAVRSLLHKMGFRFRLHKKDLPGKPDITLARYQSIIFVHGCFWHGHSCRRGKLPDTRKEFWLRKINSNRKRDSSNIMSLKALGYRVLVVWECELRDKETLADRLKIFLKSEKPNGSTAQKNRP